MAKEPRHYSRGMRYHPCVHPEDILVDGTYHTRDRGDVPYALVDDVTGLPVLLFRWRDSPLSIIITEAERKSLRRDPQDDALRRFCIGVLQRVILPRRGRPRAILHDLRAINL